MTGAPIINGCTTTRIFCRPNCPPGRRTKMENRVRFASAEEASAAGFRPCRVCKPLGRTSRAVAAQAREGRLRRTTALKNYWA